MDMPFFVYILASKRNGTLYIGVTNNLARRIAEHKAKLVPGFTRQYGSIGSSISKRLIPFSKPVRENMP
jgi:predicted GIY-YIG superfamily endonuclease